MPVPREDAGQTKGYRIFLSGIKGVIRVLILICLIVLIIFLARSAYQVGYDVTGAVPVSRSKEDAIESMVVITADMSVKEIAKLLINKRLIDEDAYAFVIQERISDYHDRIVPGTYVLDSSMTIDEMLRILSRTEEEPEEDAG